MEQIIYWSQYFSKSCWCFAANFGFFLWRDSVYSWVWFLQNITVLGKRQTILNFLYLYTFSFVHSVCLLLKGRRTSTTDIYIKIPSPLSEKSSLRFSVWVITCEMSTPRSSEKLTHCLPLSHFITFLEKVILKVLSVLLSSRFWGAMSCLISFTSSWLTMGSLVLTNISMIMFRFQKCCYWSIRCTSEP